MRHILFLLAACLYLNGSLSFAGDGQPGSERTSTIQILIDRAISRQLISGGVVVIGGRDGVLQVTGRGRLNAAADAPILTEHTMFDIASLTKVIATAPAVMKLLDEGRISLMDPVTRWFPEFRGSGRDNITILNLLTHTSGLNDSELTPENAMATAIHRAVTQKNYQRPGSSFQYADINFILLGELVRRVSGKTLDVFCREQLYAPLGMQESMFLPPRAIAASIAPTAGPAQGVVQDKNAFRLGGVAGHAGLFSSAFDLARYARLFLNGGMVDGSRILSERVISQMTSPYFCNNGAVVRGLGWDIMSPYSAPKGIFSSDMSFGHTGYSGSSIWIDPQRDLFVILLTNRINYHDVSVFNQLRRDISTVAMADYRMPGGSQLLSLTGETAGILEDLLHDIRPPVHNPFIKSHTINPTRLQKVAYKAGTRSHHPDSRKHVKNHRRKHVGRRRLA